MRNFFRHLSALPLVILLCLAAAPRQACSAGQPERYAVQIASMTDAGRVQRLYAALRADLGPELHALLRVERIGALHAFRVGAFASRGEAQQVLEGLRSRHPDASIVLAPVLPGRIVLPARPAGGELPLPAPSPETGLRPAAQAAPDSAPELSGQAGPAPSPKPSPASGPELETRPTPSPAEPLSPPAPAPMSATETGAQPPPHFAPDATHQAPGPDPATPPARAAQPPVRPAPRPAARDMAPTSSWGILIESLSSSRQLQLAALASVLLLLVSLAVLLRAVLRRRTIEIAGPWRETALNPFADGAKHAPPASAAKKDQAEAEQAGAGPDFAQDTGPEAIPAPVPEPVPAAAAGPAPAPLEVPGPEPGAEEAAQPAREELAEAALEASGPELAGEEAAEFAREELAETAPEVPELELDAAESVVALQDMPAPAPAAAQTPAEPAPAALDETAPEDAIPALAPEFLGRMARNSRELSQVQSNLLSAAKEAKTFYVTSCFNGEGKTTAAVEMAWALAHNAGARVLLVDWNPGAPRLHELFGVAGGPGLGEYLACGDPDCGIRATAHPNLSLLTAGAECEAAAGGGNGTGRLLLRERLATLRERFDYVVYDGHSLIGTSAAILAREFDGIVLVVEAEKTKWEVVQSAREKIEGIEGRLVGVVLNKRKFYIPRFLYGKI